MNKEFKEDPEVPGQLGRAIDDGQITSESQLWQYVGRAQGGISIQTEKTLAAGLNKSTDYTEQYKSYMHGYAAQFAGIAKDEFNYDGSTSGKSQGVFARFKYQADKIIADARKAKIPDGQIFNPDGPIVKQLDSLADRMGKTLGPGGGVSETSPLNVPSTPQGGARRSMNAIANDYFTKSPIGGPTTPRPPLDTGPVPGGNQR